MIIPFDVEDLVEINPECKVSSNETFICIDDFYKNFDDIYSTLHNTSVERWKGCDTTRNFIDYYDCRLFLKNNSPKPKIHDRYGFLFKVLKEQWNIDTNKYYFPDGIMVFNYFKHNKKNINNKFQHHPHVDSSAFNIITYIDSFTNGGTAIYSNDTTLRGDTTLQNREHINLLEDISKLKIEHIIPAKPNRCVIFKSDLIHGAYIEDNNIYFYNWRINQLLNLYKSTN